MSTNKSTKTPITPYRRRTLAIGRILTNIRQLMQLEPPEEIITLIEQHSTLLQTMYRHHAALTAQETSQSRQSDAPTSETPSTESGDNEAQPNNVVEPNTSESLAEKTPASITSQEVSSAPPVTKTIVRLPRKLKKTLSKLPPDHPMLLRYQKALSNTFTNKNP